MNMGTRAALAGQFDHVQTLEQVVEEYRHLFEKSKGGKNHDDPVVEFTAISYNLQTAILRAVQGYKPDGKMFSKGSCVSRTSKYSLLLSLLNDFRFRALKEAKCFEDIYNTVDAAAPKGIGRMTKYAVSERLGAYLGIKPEAFLYLHAGPLIGYKKLIGKLKPGTFRVPWDKVPEPLRALPCYHVENLLCEFREVLKPEMLSL